jgi:hypothetical protein
VRSDSYDLRELVRCVGHDERSSVLKTRKICSGEPQPREGRGGARDAPSSIRSEGLQ